MSLFRVAVLGIVVGIAGSIAARRVVRTVKNMIHVKESLAGCLAWMTDTVSVASSVFIGCWVLIEEYGEPAFDRKALIVLWFLIAVLVAAGWFWIALLWSISSDDAQLTSYPKTLFSRLRKTEPPWPGPALFKKVRPGLVYAVTLNLVVAIFGLA